MTPAVDAVRRANVEHRLIEYDSDVEHGYGEEAATALGVAPDLVFKTLVAKLDGKRLAIALVPVKSMLNLKALAALSEAKHAEMATPREAERTTGYRVGGISPLGQRRRLPAFADASIEAHARVYVSAGRRGLELELSPRDLVALTGARLGPIAS